MKEFDTICAIATALGEGGIAIIRISGDKALDIASKIFKAKNNDDIKKENDNVIDIEREFKKKNKFTRDETVKVAVKALQNTLSMEFRSTDIEIAIATKEQPTIKIMTEKEIEAELTRIGEID